VSFKDQIAGDLGSVFFAADEFAETVNIEGTNRTVVIDDDRLQKRAATEYQGVSTGLILYFIPVSALPSKPAIGGTQVFNNRMMYVDDVKVHAGVYEILLNQNRGE